MTVYYVWETVPGSDPVSVAQGRPVAGPFGSVTEAVDAVHEIPKTVLVEHGKQCHACLNWRGDSRVVTVENGFTCHGCGRPVASSHTGQAQVAHMGSPVSVPVHGHSDACRRNAKRMAPTA
jgi:hypothetical protein